VRAGRLAAIPRRNRRNGGVRRFQLLWTIIVILLVLWLLGLIGSIGGDLIWLLLVIAGVVLLFQLISGRRAV
jgi:fatty acid desaturase